MGDFDGCGESIPSAYSSSWFTQQLHPARIPFLVVRSHPSPPRPLPCCDIGAQAEFSRISKDSPLPHYSVSLSVFIILPNRMNSTVSLSVVKEQHFKSILLEVMYGKH